MGILSNLLGRRIRPGLGTLATGRAALPAPGPSGVGTALAKPVMHPLLVNAGANQQLVLAAARIRHIESYVAAAKREGRTIPEAKLDHFRHELLIHKANLALNGIEVE